uniref:Uncharacterized protein n=1 Tax=Strix occidentalis caurina TaxID=311401 RepID=A0A8D0KYE9_STROC
VFFCSVFLTVFVIHVKATKNSPLKSLPYYKILCPSEVSELILLILTKHYAKSIARCIIQLFQEYEAIYLAKLTIQMMSPLQLERSLSVPPGTTGSLKRMHEEDEELGTMQVAAAQNG